MASRPLPTRFSLIIITDSGAAKGLSNKQVINVSLGEVVSKPGIFKPHNGKYHAKLSTHSMGGFIVLSVSQKGKTILKEVKDVIGIAWITPSQLVYTVSPVYGNPGFYILDCNSKKAKRIIAPKNISAAYPNGTDYFELSRLAADNIYFYYAIHVDSVDFKEFRIPKFLFKSKLDGGDVKRVDN